MVHPFDLRDIPLVTRLENSGAPLCNELALVHGLSPLRSALVGYLSPRKYRTHTCITWGDGGPEGFVQMRPRPASGHGVITYIAPSLSSDNNATAWRHLLEAVAIAAGEMGLQQLIAEAPAEGLGVDVLRQAGFAVYLRQDVLRLVRGAQRKVKVESPTEPSPLREATSVDAWAVQQLYYNTVPRLAQLAEAIPRIRPSNAVCGHVLEENNEVMAYLEIRRGAIGAWLNVMIHPQAEMHAQHVLARGLTLLGNQWNKPIYCCVRRYQEWLWEPLLALGFEAFLSSMALVKRLVVPIAEPEWALAAALEAHPQKATSPIVRAVRDE